MKQRSFMLSYQRVSSSSSNLAAAMLKVQQNLPRKIQNPLAYQEAFNKKQSLLPKKVVKM